jgi:type IV pilus assembly protein PilV
MLRRAGRRRAQGHSLVEVMVAIAIFAVGLFGVAAMLLGATRASANALSRSQAAILASFIVERMRSNPVGVEGGAFDVVTIDTDGAAGAPSSCAGTSSSCDAGLLADHDVHEWRQRVASELPGVDGGVACAPSGTLRRCVVSLRWTQSLARRELAADATDSAADETYVLEVTL